MDRDHRVDVAKWVSIVLAIGAPVAIGYSRLVTLEKADDTKTELIRQLQREQAELRRERESLSGDVRETRVNVAQLSKDMGEVKNEVREINGKLRRR